MIGLWKSKETGKLAEVVSATEDAVWYVIPEWNGPQNCARDVFESSMEPVEAEPSRPSNAKGEARAESVTSPHDQTP